MDPAHVLYIDDSGTKEYHPARDYSGGNSRYFVFGGLLASAAEAGRLVDRVIAAKRRFFGTEDVEVKSNWLRIPKERKARYLDPLGVDEATLTAFVDDYYEIVAEADVQLLAGVVDKVHMQEDYRTPWYPPAVAYEVLLQRVVQEIAPPGRVYVIIDDMTGATPKGNQYKANLLRHHDQLRQRGSSLYRGIDFSPVAGSVRFVNSAHSHQIQVADIVAYNVYRQFEPHRIYRRAQFVSAGRRSCVS